MLLVVLGAGSGGCSDRHESATEISGDTIIVRGDPVCPACEIVLEPIASLGHDDDPVSPWEGAWMTRTSDGRFFLTAGHGVAGILEYASTGRLRAVHGRDGEGPGEYRNPMFLATIAGDTIVVYDAGLRRFSLLDSEGEFAGFFTAPFSVSGFAPDLDGTILASGIAGTTNPGEQGLPVHRIDRSGNIIESIGDSLGPVRPGGQVSSWRSISVSPEGVTVIAKTLTYELTVRFPDGRTSIIVRDVPWFPEEEREPSSYFPFLQKTWIDSSGRLWVTTRSYFENEPSPGDRDPDSPGSILEVFDLSSGNLLASRRFDFPVVLHDGLAYAPGATPSGGTTLRVFRPVFVGPTP